MPRLRVSVGAHPDDYRQFRTVHLNQMNQPTPIRAESFTGEVSVFVSDCVVYNDGTARSTGQTANPGSKKFSIQLTGQFQSSNVNHVLHNLTADPMTGRPYSYDDVFLCAELPKPVSWSSVPVPGWIAKLIWR
jgi:hypothetical protein